MKPLNLASILAALLLPVAANAQQAVFLVRHAELPGAAMADPKNVPISPTGKARAQRLAALLKDAGISAIYVTDFTRTKQTAQPLAKELGKDLVVVPKGDPKLLVERLRKDNANQTVLLVGHTDTLPGLIKALGYPSDIKIEAQDYGNVFIVTPKGEGAPAFLRLRY
ncbi:MAG TPA: phosphoglycerate mutase family protein [Burkholderiales bacterium]|jgi:broad specificity phosphatase PhoE